MKAGISTELLTVCSSCRKLKLTLSDDKTYITKRPPLSTVKMTSNLCSLVKV